MTVSADPCRESPRFIEAAGGIVWRTPERQELAVIYRDRYERDECCLPKGKLDPGEDWERAAVREVLEETGCEATIERFGGLLTYYVGERPKVVLYFEMLAVADRGFQPSREVREMRWLSPQAALGALEHAAEKGVLLRCLSAAWARRAPVWHRPDGDE